jgi:hypothetical protein
MVCMMGQQQQPAAAVHMTAALSTEPRTLPAQMSARSDTDKKRAASILRSRAFREQQKKRAAQALHAGIEQRDKTRARVALCRERQAAKRERQAAKIEASLSEGSAWGVAHLPANYATVAQARSRSDRVGDWVLRGPVGSVQSSDMKWCVCTCSLTHRAHVHNRHCYAGEFTAAAQCFPRPQAQAVIGDVDTCPPSSSTRAAVLGSLYVVTPSFVQQFQPLQIRLGRGETWGCTAIHQEDVASRKLSRVVAWSVSEEQLAQAAESVGSLSQRVGSLNQTRRVSAGSGMMATFTAAVLSDKDLRQAHDSALQRVQSLVGSERATAPFLQLSPWVVLSKNLHNEAHLDPGDKSTCYALFLETKPGTACQWAFVLPNLGPTGVIIWLQHGTVICWDGRMVRHCTSLDPAGSGEGNTTLGFFVSAAR